MPKVYICDSGLVNLLADNNEKNLFENSVYQNLKNEGKINYYCRKSGIKVDFIIDQKKAYDVKINPTEYEHRKLKSLTKEIGCVNYKIVSKNHSTLDNVTYGFML